MNNDNGSARSLIEAGRGGRKRAGSSFDLRDKVLEGICAMPESTINEIAVEYFDWYREPYKNAQKRAFDLVKLGYIEQMPNRQCRFTGKSCHVYKIKQKGLQYLRYENKMPKAGRPGIVETTCHDSVQPSFSPSSLKSFL